jgi:hypothetical protein
MCPHYQTGKGGSNPLTILREVVRESGFTGLYSGWAAYIVRYFF